MASRRWGWPGNKRDDGWVFVPCCRGREEGSCDSGIGGPATANRTVNDEPRTPSLPAPRLRKLRLAYPAGTAQLVQSSLAAIHPPGWPGWPGSFGNLWQQTASAGPPRLTLPWT